MKSINLYLQNNKKNFIFIFSILFYPLLYGSPLNFYIFSLTNQKKSGEYIEKKCTIKGLIKRNLVPL